MGEHPDCYSVDSSIAAAANPAEERIVMGLRAVYQSPCLMSLSVLLDVTMLTPHCSIHWYPLTIQPMYSCMYSCDLRCTPDLQKHQQRTHLHVIHN